VRSHASFTRLICKLFTTFCFLVAAQLVAVPVERDPFYFAGEIAKTAPVSQPTGLQPTGSQPVESRLAPVKAPESKPKISLLGVTNVGGKKSALLSFDGRADVVHQQSLFHGYRIKSIEQNHAILEHAGKTIRLSLSSQEFEQLVEQIKKSSDKQLERLASELANDPEKLDRFLGSLPTGLPGAGSPQASLLQAGFEKETALSPDTRRLLHEQYADPVLTNKKILLSLKRANTRDVISFLAKSAGLNFVVDPDVKGVLHAINFVDVSLATALQSLLQSNRPPLALIKEQNIYRIVPLARASECLTVQDGEDFEAASIPLMRMSLGAAQKKQIEQFWAGVTGPKALDARIYLVLDEEHRIVFCRGRKHHVAALKKFLREIDREVSQVKIEARFVCAEKGFEDTFGLQWSGVYNRRASIGRGVGFVGVGKPLSAISNNPVAPSQASLVDWALNFLPTAEKAARNIHIPFIFGGSDLNTKRLNLVLNAAENKNEIKTILNPTVLTNDREPAEILVGENVPIETVIEESVEGRLRNTRTATYKDIGIQFKVTPVVSSDKKSVTLDIFIENSQQSDALTTDKTTYPIIRTTRSKTRVRLRNGQTTMISGLIKNVKELYKSSYPLLGDIPLLGLFFKGSRKTAQDVQLLIFITPTIV